MSTTPTTDDLVLAISPVATADHGPWVVVAATSGGGRGVLDLADGDHLALRALELAARRSMAPIGVRVPSGCAATPAQVDAAAGGRVDLVVLACDSPWPVAESAPRYRILVEVTDRAAARRAQAAGAHGLVARGLEAGGPVGEFSSFVLLQHLLADDQLTLPVWVAGGIGPRTAVACLAGGAAGVVLDSQLALMPEADLPDEVSAAIRRMDGSETVVVGGQRGLRLGNARRGAAESRTDRYRPGEWLPVGQDGALAEVFANRWRDTTAAVRGVIAELTDAVADDSAALVLAPGAPLAAGLGIGVPIAQGPMTRVSDQPAFAGAVAAEGGLPFIALALADGAQTARLLDETAGSLGERPWGVGVLGFAPDEIRDEQIEVIRRVRPAYAIIAGGRPAQAKLLDEVGVVSFLHVPSPGLLRQFLRAGSRRFVFEGAECGGHVGPQTSFPLWEAQLTVLAEYLDTASDVSAESIYLFFAGGIHDARSAAMVAAMSAPLARRGVRIGVLMGTAYLFTQEAVAHGAIRPLFQQQALAAERTTLLETAPGHATRCLVSPFADEFAATRSRLEASGVDSRQVWAELETLNVGRLRIASKGLRRSGVDTVQVDEQIQGDEGLFMAGQVAALRSAPTTVAELHREVSDAGVDFARARTAELRDTLDLPVGADDRSPRPPLDIAIVGMSAIFPKSPDLGTFWHTILSSTDTISEVPADRWPVETYYRAGLGREDAGLRSSSKWGGFLPPTRFDPLRYGIPPAALASIEPAQLLSLQAADQALTDAGYAYDAPGAQHERTGVVFGAEAGSDLSNASVLRALLPAYLGEVPAELDRQLPRMTEDSFPGMLGNVIAGRIANRLDLRGPNYTVDAACASSLAAVDVACRELASGTSDLMLCGGVDLHNGIYDYMLFSSVYALSPTGRSRTFDSNADGTTLGEGVACVVLKRLADAQRDGDRIYAVIKATGAASDGRALGLTAPRPDGQQRALRRAYDGAGIAPRQVGLVEAHGTGTVVGDRTELESLTRVFIEDGADPGGCALGSVKSQIGHTKCAAGLAGLIKAALAVYTGIKPPTLHLKKPNSAWQAENSPFSFHRTPQPWALPADQRFAGVSAFGFGGTNFHVVLSGQASTMEPRHAQQVWPAELFCLRGADVDAAHRAVRQLADLAAENTRRGRPVGLRDLAATTARRDDPRSGPVRVAVVARDLDELEKLLHRALAGEHDPAGGLVQPGRATTDEAPGQVALLFPGQGSQRPGMLGELFVTFPELRQHLDPRWTELLFPPAAFDPGQAKEQRARLRDTRVAQPALGITGIAAEQLLRRLGVRPDMVGGHSYGELVALCAAGVFESSALLTLSRQRAAAILEAAGADPGTMAAVSASPAEVAEALTRAGLAGTVTPANHNAPDQVVISGTTPAVENAVEALGAAGLRVRRLSVACAFHSPVVAGGATRFAEALAEYPVTALRIPVWSNRTAEPYRPDGSDVHEHLAAQIGEPVRFAEQIESMYAAGARIFVEAGPGGVLTGLVAKVLGERDHLAVTCDPDPEQGLRGLLVSLGRLACAGVPVRTGWLFHGRPARVDVSADRLPEPAGWTVDGQLVRDRAGAHLPGGLMPARQVKELRMASSDAPTNGAAVVDRTVLLAEFLRGSREMLAAQRDALLACFGDGPAGRMVWQPAEQPRDGELASGWPARVEPAGTSVATLSEVSAPASPADVDFRSAVLAVISERTGYPIDLIEPDLDLEADLSIDSIKRAEIVGEVAVRLHLDDGDEADLEQLVKSRTVRGMIDWLTDRVAGALDEAAPAPAPEDPGLSAAPPSTAEPVPAMTPTRLMSREAPLEVAPAADRLADATVLVTGDTAIAARAAEVLRERGANVRTAAGLAALEDAALQDAALEDRGPLDGVVWLDGLEPDGPALLPGAVATVKQLLAARPKWLLGAAAGPVNARVDGLRGLFRSIAQEYPDMVTRLVEVDGAPTDEDFARSLADELTAPGRPPVVRQRDGGWHHLLPQPADLGILARTGAGPTADGSAEAHAIGLASDSVIVLLGGARGITAWCARALAAAGRCRIELAGRTPMPAGATLPEAADAAALRTALAAGGMRVPAEIEQQTRQILAGREVVDTLSALRECGGEVNYHVMDVRDDEAVHRLLKEIHGRYGRIDGVVYAAGVTEDRLLADKDPQSFAHVYRTKVDGAAAVLNSLTEIGCSPAFVALFGSVAAVYGNRGQADYAAANDALESMGARWAQRTGNRCLTVHWGPWAPKGAHAGMVTPELVREYARRGIGLIDPEAGAASLLRELAWGDVTTTSVVYTATGAGPTDRR